MKSENTQNDALLDSSEGLRKLLVEGLKEIYSAEKILTRAIPKMIDNATSEELIEALTDHLETTEGHIKRLEKVFSLLGKIPDRKQSQAILGLVRETEEMMVETEKGVVRDAAIILAAQKATHYEKATYSTLCIFAHTLEESNAAHLLEKTLIEETLASEKLMEIATYYINTEVEKDQ